jgi:adenine-specific DNA methylase
MGKKIFSNDLLTSSAITAVCLLENKDIPLSQKDLKFLCNNVPKKCGTFVLDNYKDKFFTEKECKFLDRYRANVEELCGDKFYCGLEILNKATLMSIPNSNFSVYGKDLKSLRSTHEVGKSFWQEKWRDTTRKRRDANNEIMFNKSIKEVYDKYKSAFSLFAIENHVNQHCFLGGRYYNGQTIANIEHRLSHDKDKGVSIDDLKNGIPKSMKKIGKALTDGSACVFNSDIIDLLEADILEADLLYLDPPYGGASSDYAVLYRFLEEYLYECKLEDMEHIQKGAKRFAKKKGYQEHFEHLLSLCDKFPVWLTSYNESSYANLDIITSTIKNAGRSTVKVFDVPITYQYRKGKNLVEKDKTVGGKVGFDPDKDLTHSERGTEYLILAY